MGISLTWADVIVHSLIGLGVVYAAFLLSKLYNHLAPRAADYWARRSVSTAQRKIARLEQRLEKYEADFSDSRLFFARSMQNGVLLLFCLIIFVGMILMSALFHITANIRCEFHHNCPDVWNMPTFWEASYDEQVSHIFLFTAMIVEFVGIQVSDKFRREISPTTFRDYLQTRIAKLRRRIPGVINRA